MSDNIRHSSLSRKAGRSLAKAFRALFGDRFTRKTAQSLDALKEEFDAGKAEADAKEPPPKRIRHREIDPNETNPEEP